MGSGTALDSTAIGCDQPNWGIDNVIRLRNLLTKGRRRQRELGGSNYGLTKRYHNGMSVGTLISLDEYLRTSYRPDCDFIEGEVQERNVGKRRHAYAQGQIIVWFGRRSGSPRLIALPELRTRVAAGRVRIPDVSVCKPPLPDEEVFTTPPYLCVEVMSPDDTIANMQDRLDDYLSFGIANVWVVDPWKHRGWTITRAGWASATDAIMRTADGEIAMPLADVLLP
jgi:Uma2 family endonuclease